MSMIRQIYVLVSDLNRSGNPFLVNFSILTICFLEIFFKGLEVTVQSEVTAKASFLKQILFNLFLENEKKNKIFKIEKKC